MRTPIIAGNWKMNMTPPEAQALVKALLPLAKDAKCQVVVCPPFVCLPSVRALLSGSNVVLGAQNMHYEAKGAFTGEVSADMLKAVGVEYVILGHSERRQYFAETDETVNKKAKAALQAGLTPIICVGESLEQREAGKAESVVSTQTALAFDGLSAEDAAKAVVAYEPIWAIGTGKTATKEDANTTIGTIRKALRGMYGDVADAIRIQYGGSMNAKNASELMAMPEIDGGLIGGASLKAEDFSCIIHF